MSIHKNYSQFFQRLDEEKIEWCLIKDYDYLMKTGYDNEIDLITREKDRDKIRSLARKLRWYESSLNIANTHLIFWKFEGLKPFRIDVHLDKALATAVPWLNACDILKNKIKKKFIYSVSPEYELALLLMGSFRGRKPKLYRIKQAIILNKYLSNAKLILKGRLTEEEVERYYSHLIKGKVVKFSKLRRLGILNIIKERVLLFKLFIYKIFSPSSVLIVDGSNTVHKHKLLNNLLNELSGTKLNVSLLTNPNFFKIYWKRITTDLVIINNVALNTNLGQHSVKKEIEYLINSVYP